ncbi:MAG TPA: hypothetical protein VHE77_07835 [Dongiaceae bacterium]|nr:hypothetical protein [Dongiaceae bacterium]
MFGDWLSERRWWILAVLCVGGLCLQFSALVNADVAWIVYSAARMLHGQVFGRDILEQNPPLIWYLSTPIAYAWDTWGLDLRLSIRVLSVATVLWSLAIIDRFPGLKSSPFGRLEISVLMIAMGYWFFVGGGESFGQREYLCLVLGLPYMMMAPARYGAVRLGRADALLIGLGAGLAFAIKPNFLVIPVLLELASMVRSRRLAPLFRTETWTILVLTTGYAEALPFVAPDFVKTVVPYVEKYYWAGNRPFLLLAMRVSPFCAIWLANFYMYLRGERGVLNLATLAASAGFLISYFVQQKGYEYHVFPFEALVSAGAALSLIPAGPPLVGRALHLVTLGAAFILGFVALEQWYDRENVFFGQRASETQSLIGLIDSKASGGSFLALTAHPYPGFPLALYVNAIWASRTELSDYLIAVARLRAGGTNPGSATLAETEASAWAALKHDLDTYHPNIILVSDPPPTDPTVLNYRFDILDFYLEDPEIRAAWKDYVELPRLATVRVFQKVGPASSQ